MFLFRCNKWQAMGYCALDYICLCTSYIEMPFSSLLLHQNNIMLHLKQHDGKSCILRCQFSRSVNFQNHFPVYRGDLRNPAGPPCMLENGIKGRQCVAKLTKIIKLFVVHHSECNSWLSGHVMTLMAFFPL